MTFEIAIVEDEWSSYNTLVSYLDTCQKEFGVEFSVKWFKDGITFLEKYPQNCKVVFMDIDLPLLNGMETVRKLRKIDANVVVVFVTNLAQYAVKGYEVSAFDFIVKPLSYYDFHMKFKRVMKSFSLQPKKCLWVTTRSGKRKVEADEICYVEVMKHEITYNMRDGEKITFSGTLKQICDELTDLPFVMCNRCYLVNLAYVKEVRGEDLYIGNDRIQIALARRKEFMKSLNKYLSDGGK